MTINVLLVDDQALFREALNTLLSIHEQIEVVAEAENGQQAVELALVHQPDVILMDLRMPVLNGVAATRRLAQEYPTGQVIVLTTFDEDEDIFEALQAGAVGYLLKDVPSAKLVEAIEAAARGESVLQPSVAVRVVNEFARLAGHRSEAQKEQEALVEALSDRELEVLQVIATGASNKEIAQQLYIAEGTVKNHVTNILGKLGVRDRTQAALKGRELGLLSDGD